MINLFLHLFSITDRYETREICDRAIFEDPFMLAYYPDKYKTQRMCHEAVDDCLAALNLFLIGLLQVKSLKISYCFIRR